MMTDKLTEALNQSFEIPERYKALGVATGFDPCPPDNLRMIDEAEPGQGKTQFIMSMPGVLMLDFDLAAENTVGQQASRIHIRTWSQYEKVKAMLLDDAAKNKKEWRRVAFDTVDAFLLILDKHLLEPVNEARVRGGREALTTILAYGEHGAGYTKLSMALVREIYDFWLAGYPYILSCHMQVKTTTIGESRFTERRCVMPPSTMDKLIPMVDVKARMARSMDSKIGIVKKSVPDGKGGTRIVKIKDSANPEVVHRYWMNVMPSSADQTDDDTKRRIPELAGVIEVPLIDGWGAFTKLYKEAVARATALGT